jgi:hypothetical protein
MEPMNNQCAGMDGKLAVMLLEPEKAPAKVQAHVAGCDRCRRELAELRATLDLLATWDAPEPSPYFMTRFDARLREARAAEPAGWFARLRARFAYGPAMHVRPLAAMALSVLLLLGGGTYLGVADFDKTAQPAPQAAVVHDLQTLDSNAQLLDQMEALSTTNDDNGE